MIQKKYVKNINKYKFKQAIAFLFVALFIATSFNSYRVSANSSIESHQMTIGQSGKIEGVNESSYTSTDDYIVDLVGDTIRATGTGKAYLKNSENGDMIAFSVYVPDGTTEFNHNTDGRKLLHGHITAGANQLLERYSFITKLNLTPAEKPNAKIELSRFLPNASEFRLAYCYGYELRYGISDMDDGRTYSEATLTFLYLPDAKVALALSGAQVEINSMEKHLLDKSNSIIKLLGLKNMKTKHEKTLAVHDYLVKNTAFDVAATKEADWRTNSDSYSAYGALVRGKATCKGYALAMKLLLEASGVECDYIVGKKSVLHAWNRVKLDDGSWYHIDVSGDDPLPDRPNKISYRYYALTDKEMSKTHTFTAGNIKCNETKYSYENTIKLMKTNKK